MEEIRLMVEVAREGIGLATCADSHPFSIAPLSAGAIVSA